MQTLETVKRFIEQQKLLDADRLCLVALSGGADSVCLLRMLLQLGYQAEAAHCNFHLRGAESDRDERFVVNLCKELDVKLHLIHFDTQTYAKLHKVSIEMAARQLRYRYFEQLRVDTGASDVCVAHHQDDSIETVLMNLVRGTGIHGLTGIKPRRQHIVRPLLCIGRNDILEYLEELGQDFVTDSTNLQADIVRNRLRLNVVPQLCDAVPQAKANILRTARLVAEATRVYDDAMATSMAALLTHDTVDTALLLGQPSPESILFEWLSPAGFSPSCIEDIERALHQGRTGSEWHSDSHQLTIHRGRLILEQASPTPPTLLLPETGTYLYNTDDRISIELRQGSHIEADAKVCCADAAKLSFPLTLRPARQGDRFQPLGMKGSKLVSDYLTDRHLSVFEKRRTLVLTDATDTIVWLVGHRPSHRFRVLPTTASTVVISFRQGQKQPSF